MCNIQTYKSLHRIALRHGGKVRIIRKRGIPFLLYPLKNRTGFFLGALAFVFIISFLSSFIWNIEITGNSRIRDTTIFSYLEHSELSVGKMWSSVDRDRVKWQMMSDFDDIAWVHINKNGSTAIVEINETKNAPTPDEEKLKGVRIFRKELQAVAYRQQNGIAINDINTYKKIIFFSVKIPLYFKAYGGDFEEESTNYLTVKDKQLPIGIETKTVKRFTAVPKELKDNELVALAKKKLKFNEEKEFDGYKIINKSIHYEIEDDKCSITGAYVLRRGDDDTEN